MNISKLIMCIFILKFLAVSHQNNYYKKVIHIVVSNKTYYETVDDLLLKGELNALDWDFLIGKTVTFKAEASSKGLEALKQAKISFDVLEENVNQASCRSRWYINYSIPAFENDTLTFKRVMDYDEILKYIQMLSKKSTSQRKVTVEIIGKTYQNRDMHLVKIEHPNAQNIMFFGNGIHAREWLAHLQGFNLIQNLIATDYADPINNMNWYIVPYINPDGFVYSIEEYRLHRKNLNFTTCPCIIHCGVDLNRNFDYKWGVNAAKGDTCQSDYPGVHAFSEKESQALSKTLKKYLKHIKLYVSLHTQGCKIFYPWGYEEKECDDAKDLIEAADKAVDAMNKHKERPITCDWRTMNAGAGGAGGGGDDDYAKGTLGIKYSYTMEFQKHYEHFDFSNEFILPAVKQGYIGITTLANYIQSLNTCKTCKDVKASSACGVPLSKILLYLGVVYYFIKIL